MSLPLKLSDTHFLSPRSSLSFLSLSLSSMSAVSPTLKGNHHLDLLHWNSLSLSLSPLFFLSLQSELKRWAAENESIRPFPDLGVGGGRRRACVALGGRLRRRVSPTRENFSSDSPSRTRLAQSSGRPPPRQNFARRRRQLPRPRLLWSVLCRVVLSVFFRRLLFVKSWWISFGSFFFK